MKMFSRMCFVLFICVAALPIRAQVAGCASGDIPMTAAGVSTCLPGNTQPQTQEPQPPVPKWESRWGAIATDAPHAALGAVTGSKNKSGAERAAIADCHAKGGVDCQVQVSYANSCAALAVSASSGGTASRADVSEAQQAALDVCKQGGGSDCRVYYSACSPAERVR